MQYTYKLKKNGKKIDQKRQDNMKHKIKNNKNNHTT